MPDENDQLADETTSASSDGDIFELSDLDIYSVGLVQTGAIGEDFFAIKSEDGGSKDGGSKVGKSLPIATRIKRLEDISAKAKRDREALEADVQPIYDSIAKMREEFIIAKAEEEKAEKEEVVTKSDDEIFIEAQIAKLASPASVIFPEAITTVEPGHWDAPQHFGRPASANDQAHQKEIDELTKDVKGHIYTQAGLKIQKSDVLRDMLEGSPLPPGLSAKSFLLSLDNATQQKLLTY